MVMCHSSPGTLVHAGEGKQADEVPARRRAGGFGGVCRDKDSGKVRIRFRHCAMPALCGDHGVQLLGLENQGRDTMD